MINVKLILGGVVSVVILLFVISMIRFVDQGERGVVLRFGEVDRLWDSGLHFKLPIVEKVYMFSVRTHKIEVDASASSFDLQDVSTKIAVHINIPEQNVARIYTEYGSGDKFVGRIVLPAIQEAVKLSTARFTADKLITEREKVKEGIVAYLSDRLTEAGIALSNTDITDFRFSGSFNAAIEEKVRAEQEALREKNVLERVKYEAEQKVVKAEAEAESIRLQAISLQNSPQYIEKLELEVQQDAIEKWNGVLPTHFVPNSAVPFVNVGN